MEGSSQAKQGPTMSLKVIDHSAAVLTLNLIVVARDSVHTPHHVVLTILPDTSALNLGRLTGESIHICSRQ